MLKVSIFNAVLAEDADPDSEASIRGYFVCARNEPHFKARLRDALAPLSLRLANVEREQEISEELLLQSLPHVHAMYRLRGYGLELYHLREDQGSSANPALSHAMRRFSSGNLLADRFISSHSGSAGKKSS